MSEEATNQDEATSMPSEVEVASQTSTGTTSVPFALTPARANNEVLDYTSKEGRKQYELATKFQGVSYEVSAADMRSFLSEAKRHGEQQGWDTSVFAIPKDINRPTGDYLNLIESYGEITKEHIAKHARTYVESPTRAAQDSIALYHWAMNNLSKEGKAKMVRLTKEYTIRGTQAGALFIKVYTAECRADSRATISAIRSNLRNLPEYFPSVEFDVPKLREYTIDQLHALEVRGAETHDLLDILFQTMKKAPNQDFVDFIGQSQNDWERNKIELTPESLLDDAKSKYLTLIDTKQWDAPSEETAKIVALESKLMNLEKQLKSKKDQGNDNNAGRNRDGNRDGKRKEKEAWMLKPPQPGDRQPKHWNKKDWWYCEHHKEWTRHKSDECKKMGVKPNNDADSPSEREVQAAQATLRLRSNQE